MIKVAQEGQTAKQEKGVQDVRVETNHAARKFYAQRNCKLAGTSITARAPWADGDSALLCRWTSIVYLTGATLFLAVLLTRVFAIVLDLIMSQEQLNALKTNVSLAVHPPIYRGVLSRRTDHILLSPDQTSKTAVAAGPNKSLQSEVSTLKEQLAAKDRDLGKSTPAFLLETLIMLLTEIFRICSCPEETGRTEL